MREARQAARQEDGQTPGNILPPPMASLDGIQRCGRALADEAYDRIDEQALIATAKQGTVPPVGAVEPLSIQSVEVAHDAGEITQGGLKEQVVMSGHAAVGEDLDPPAAVNVLEQVEEAVVIGVPEEDPPALQAAVHDMVVGTGELDAQRSSHSASLRAS